MRLSVNNSNEMSKKLIPTEEFSNCSIINKDTPNTSVIKIKMNMSSLYYKFLITIVGKEKCFF